jgi:hypothetical protein
MKTKLFLFLGSLALLAAVVLPARAAEAPIYTADLVFAGDDFAAGELISLRTDADGLTLAPDASTGSYLSPILEAPLAYNAVVPEWLATVPESAGLSLRLRTGTANGWWSEWYDIAPNDDWMAPEDPTWVGQMIAVPAADVTHSRIQFSLAFSRYVGQPAPVLAELRLVFIDSSRGPTAAEMVARQAELDASRPQEAPAGYPKPSVVSRDVWCVPFYGSACFPSDLEYEPVTHLIVHHTVSSNSSSNWAAVVRAIWQYHTYTRGWGDIGYNYLGDINGVLYEGHYGGDDVVGTHASGANAGSMALSLIGTFTDPDDNPPGIAPTEAMKNSAAELMAWKADQKDIDVYDASDMPNMSWGLPNLMGHRDVYGTTVCPGDQGHGILPWLRDAVAGRIGFISPYIYVDELTGAFNSGGNFYTAPYGCGWGGHAWYTWSTTDPNASANWGEWRPNLSVTGSYEVQAYAPYCVTGENETGGARYTVSHANGQSQVTVSHQANVGNWMSLGTFTFNAGTSGVIRLTDLTSTDSGLGVWFDAIRIRPLAPQVTNAAPIQAAWKSNRTVAFSWSVTNLPAANATRLEVATDPGFGNLVLAQTMTGLTTGYSHTFSADFGQLFWRVIVTATSGQNYTSPATWFGLDSTAPTSLVHTIAQLEDGRYAVGWSGDDALSGIATYTVQYRTGFSTWQPWIANTPLLGASFQPPDSQVYYFRSQATDTAGNVEPPHPVADANTSQAVLVAPAVYLPIAAR